MPWLSWETLVSPKSDGGLGFRDLHSFNMAMWAKQGWRIIQNLESLCARILKAKYFPGTHLLKARVKEGCSYTLRSILQGVQTLKNGVVWRVGNSQSINIWEHPWLPRDLSKVPITPRGRNLITKVDELIDPHTEHRDIPLLEEIFREEDVQINRSIPTHLEMDDVVGWHFHAKGIFSMKSVYKVQRAFESRGQRSLG